MHHNVRIQRKNKSFGTQACAWGNALTDLAQWMAGIFAGGYIDEECRKAQSQQARLVKVQVDTRVSLQREAKESNNVVLGDLRIEKLVMENKILAAKLKALGVDTDFEVNNYSSDQ